MLKKCAPDEIQLALIHGDPVHTIPPATGFQEALAKVPFIVSFSSLMDDTALQADLILPDHAALESWGDVIPLAGTRERVIGLMQPVVTPVFDTRQFPEVLMTAAHELGGEMKAAFPYESYLDMLKAEMRKQVGLAGGKDFEATWVDLLQQGRTFQNEPQPRQGLSLGSRREPSRTCQSPGSPEMKRNSRCIFQYIPQLPFMTAGALRFPGCSSFPTR